MLTELRPAALNLSRISGQSEGTGRRNVWNSPELERRNEYQSLCILCMETPKEILRDRDKQLMYSLKEHPLAFDK
jgi:hypothetical protein